MKKLFNFQPSDFTLLLFWVAVGAGLRFAALDAKPPWTDEFSTMVFSLGNNYGSVPLDRLVRLDALLQPLIPPPPAGGLIASAQNVTHNLLTYSNHPPVYFVLANFWMQLFPPAPGECVSLWVARSLPALLGVASVPAMFALGLLACSSRSAGHLAAAMMAVSPYGIYLAQEARHYTLAILLVICSLGCLVVAARALQQGKPVPGKLATAWVAVNALGIASHYFFALTLCAEALVLFGLWVGDLGIWGKPISGISLKKREGEPSNSRTQGEAEAPDSPSQTEPGNEGIYRVSTKMRHWWSVCAVALGTLASGLVWLPVWLGGSDSRLTEWIRNDAGGAWFEPIFQALAAWITMLSLLPVESPALPVVIASGLVMLIFFIWASPILWRGLKAQFISQENQLATGVLGGFVLSSIALFFGISYFFGIDITRGARYNFVYFPAVIALAGASLAKSWDTVSETRGVGGEVKIGGKKAVAIIWLMGLLSGLTVVCDLGYQKYYRPDLLVPVIQEVSQSFEAAADKSDSKKSGVPVLIATTQLTHVQTGELMGLAWEFRRQHPALGGTAAPQFLLAHEDRLSCEDATCRAPTTLGEVLAELPRPAALWLVNFRTPGDLLAQKCFPVKDPPEKSFQSWPAVDGYDYQAYRCF
ncbi:glycosyltransferase family 39 protein [Kamptonema formosum]|uniref:glycosyltransferase family 39 protein n=1 Tax=Kamptonema formosum TaxID=331992 RepID=UPI0003450CF3|nr:glycosyltransferase family 39 protein [Oscillatoria sp. PCC 10802]